MTPGAYCDGIQHVGIPTDHLENTIHFYEDLGLAFLQLGNLVIETYEDPVALCDGAINHIALNCLDIEKAYAATLNQKHLMLSNGIEALDFWERGVYFFIIQGPNKERIEFCQKL